MNWPLLEMSMLLQGDWKEVGVMAYTPTTEMVRDAYALLSVSVRVGTRPADAAVRAEFDRWLAAHDREVKAEALRDAADRLWPHSDAEGTITLAQMRAALRRLAEVTEEGK